ncbi:MAG: AAA family ATPase [Polyangiaceae bacterium]|nr:AAA family ATPase [Polyangiaceae bacterium]
MDRRQKGFSLLNEVRALLEPRRGVPGKGFVVVLGSAPRESCDGLKHGVGRSAVADQLARAIGAERFSTGDVFRKMAHEKGLTITELHRDIPDHPEWDADLDRKVIRRIEEAKRKGEFVVIDSNLAALLGTPNVALRIDVSDDLRAQRVASGSREGDQAFASAAEALRFLDQRSDEELARYRNHPDELYTGVDLAGPDKYQGTVDNSGEPRETLDAVLKHLLEVLGQQQ